MEAAKAIEAPLGFSKESQEAIKKWMADDTFGKKVSGNPCVRLLHKDPQRQLYVAILTSSKPKK